MDTFVPLFSKLVDSSLWDEPDHVVKVFLTMLALKVLSSPDKKRLEPQPHQGRRIAKVEDGWLVLNGATYRKMAQEVSEKFRKARWARENRAKAAQPEVNNRDDLIRVHEKHANDLKREREAEGIL